MARQRDRGKDISLPDTFTPRFWETQDGRCGAVKAIRRRYATLKAHAGADSYQKELLCQEAVFVALQLETMRVTAVESGKFDPGVYTQMVNCLSGLLTKLGLGRHVKQEGSLRAYVRERGA